VNNEIAPMLPQLVGKTIADIVLKEGSSPTGQLFLVFTDGTYYEFYRGSRSDGTTSPMAADWRRRSGTWRRGRRSCSVLGDAR
jgi:hypothetical protein